jgi:hypothetical protein
MFRSIGIRHISTDQLKAQARRFDEKCIKPKSNGKDVAKAMRAKLK